MMGVLQNQSTYENIKTPKRRRCSFCVVTGPNCLNCRQKKVEGDGDGAAESRKMIQFMIQLDCKMRATPQNRMPRMGSPT